MIEAGKDEIVWVPRGTVHHIQNVGNELSLRMARVACRRPCTTSTRASSAAIPTTAHSHSGRKSPVAGLLSHRGSSSCTLLASRLKMRGQYAKLWTAGSHWG